MINIRTSRLVFWLFVLATPVALISWSFWAIRSSQVNELRHEFPENLRLGALVAGGVNWGWPCIGAAFELEGQTSELLFDEVRTHFSLPSDYSDGWQKTPVQRNWYSEGAWPGLSCVDSSEARLDIFFAVQEPNGFYAVSPSMILFILPDIGLAVATQDDFTH